MAKVVELEFQKNPNEKYAKFFEKFNDIATLDPNEWKIVHVLGYFCKKYKDLYKIDYTWKFNTQTPSKCFEVWQVNLLGIKLSSNTSIMKDYIDWLFINKVSKLKRRFTSISFLTKDENVNSYKATLLATKNKTNINRVTILPTSYKNVFLNINKNIETYGDLAFLFAEKDSNLEVKRAFEQISMLGFSENILKEIV